MEAEEGGAEKKGLDPAGLSDEHLLLFREEGEALAQGGVGGFEWSVGLEDLGKEPATHTPQHKHTHTHRDMIQQLHRKGSAACIYT